MNRTAIDWCDYTWNPVTGCYGPGGTKAKPKWCPYCYAKRIANRFDGRAFPRAFEPTFHKKRLAEVRRMRRNSIAKVFVSSMADLFGSWVPGAWIEAVLTEVRLAEVDHPGVTFIFLTKNPKRLSHWRFPGNAWIGTSAETMKLALERVPALLDAEGAEARFVSVEPVLDAFTTRAFDPRLDWIVVGCKTPKVRRAEQRAVEQTHVLSVVRSAKAQGIPVFVKSNVGPAMFDGLLRRVQEWPKNSGASLLHSSPSFASSGE